ncbi:MAG: cysteine hydrolase family protein [Porticoccaceae bacterium]|uniref:cysteine hydrolase family protein n=1 Tax=Neptunomonas phycophila TaxID=1572645 RepID=UPI0035126949
MVDITQDLDCQKTALLVMDHQEMLINNYVPNKDDYLANLANVLEETRKNGIQIIYVRVGFRKNYPEVSNQNVIFSSVRNGGRFLSQDAGSAIPSVIAPQEDDQVILKHRVSAFEGTELQLLLRAQNISTIVVLGITTSGVVLSTVRQAADLDYKIFVLEDYCFDADAEVQKVLLEKILPMQAKVVKLKSYQELFSVS